MSYIEREAILKYSRAMLDRAEQHIRSGQSEGDIWKAIHHAQKEERAEFVGLLENAPAADVAPVRHGRWIPSDMGGGEPDEAYVCSECGEPWTLIDGNPAENNMRYCPACGARMDKEDEHEAG